MDGPISRRSRVIYHTWIGDHDLQVDMAVSVGLLLYMLAAGYVSWWLGAGGCLLDYQCALLPEIWCHTGIGYALPGSDLLLVHLGRIIVCTRFRCLDLGVDPGCGHYHLAKISTGGRARFPGWYAKGIHFPASQWQKEQPVRGLDCLNCHQPTTIPVKHILHTYPVFNLQRQTWH